MEVAVSVPLVRRAFCRTYGTDIFWDWRVGPSSKVRFETAFQARTGRTATGITADSQRQRHNNQPLRVFLVIFIEMAYNCKEDWNVVGVAPLT